MYEKKEINGYQKEKFSEYERNSVAKYFAIYENMLKNMLRSEKNIKILDVGGGSGNFAFALSKYFAENGYDAEIFVLDITKYDTWELYGDTIHFIEGSSFDIEKYFNICTFNLVFVNCAFHHLIQSSWQKTIAGIIALLRSIHKILKNDGILCVSEYFYEILFFKEISSWIIYTLSTISTPTIMTLLRKIGSKSAGVGVCFLSIDKWKRLLNQTEYKIIDLTEKPKRFVKGLPVKEQFFYFSLQKSSESVEKSCRNESQT